MGQSVIGEESQPNIAPVCHECEQVNVTRSLRHFQTKKSRKKKVKEFKCTTFNSITAVLQKHFNFKALFSALFSLSEILFHFMEGLEYHANLYVPK